MTNRLLRASAWTPALALIAAMAGCTTLQPVGQPEQFISQKQPSFVVVTTSAVQEGDDPIVINAPRVQGGSVSGLVFGEPTEVKLTEITTVKAKQFNSRRTTYLALGTAAFLAGTIYLRHEAGERWDTTACKPDGRFPQESCGGIECGGSAGSGGGNCYIGATKPFVDTNSGRRYIGSQMLRLLLSR